MSVSSIRHDMLRIRICVFSKTCTVLRNVLYIHRLGVWNPPPAVSVRQGGLSRRLATCARVVHDAAFCHCSHCMLWLLGRAGYHGSPIPSANVGCPMLRAMAVEQRVLQAWSPLSSSCVSWALPTWLPFLSPSFQCLKLDSPSLLSSSLFSTSSI